MRIINAYLAIVTALILIGCGSDKSPLVIVSDDSCGINAPTGDAVVDRQIELGPWGWAFDKSTGKIPEHISLQIISEDKRNGLRAALNRMARPDVAKAFGLPIEMAGFSGKIDIKALPAGNYYVSVVQSDGGKILLCNSPSKIILK